MIPFFAAIQAVVALAVGYPGWVHVVGCRLNIYTIPYVIFAAAAVVCIVLTQLLFKPQSAEIVRTGQAMQPGPAAKDEEQEGKPKTFYDHKGVPDDYKMSV